MAEITIDKDLMAELLADAELNVASDSSLKTVSELVTLQATLEDRIAWLEQETKDTNKMLERVATQLLPQALMDADTLDHTTITGLKVKLEKAYFANVLKDKQQAVYDHMTDNGHDGIIDTSVTIPLGKASHGMGKELVTKLADLLQRNDIQLSETIHWATLRAFAREQVEEWRKDDPDRPMDGLFPEGFSVHVINKAKITRPKKKD